MRFSELRNELDKCLRYGYDLYPYIKDLGENYIYLTPEQKEKYRNYIPWDVLVCNPKFNESDNSMEIIIDSIFRPHDGNMYSLISRARFYCIDLMKEGKLQKFASQIASSVYRDGIEKEIKYLEAKDHWDYIGLNDLI